MATQPSWADLSSAGRRGLMSAATGFGPSKGTIWLATALLNQGYSVALSGDGNTAIVGARAIIRTPGRPGSKEDFPIHSAAVGPRADGTFSSGMLASVLFQYGDALRLVAWPAWCRPMQAYGRDAGKEIRRHRRANAPCGSGSCRIARSHG
jgi:hypothetical protein